MLSQSKVWGYKSERSQSDMSLSHFNLCKIVTVYAAGANINKETELVEVYKNKMLVQI